MDYYKINAIAKIFDEVGEVLFLNLCLKAKMIIFFYKFNNIRLIAQWVPRYLYQICFCSLHVDA